MDVPKKTAQQKWFEKRVATAKMDEMDIYIYIHIYIYIMWFMSFSENGIKFNRLSDYDHFFLFSNGHCRSNVRSETWARHQRHASRSHRFVVRWVDQLQRLTRTGQKVTQVVIRYGFYWMSHWFFLGIYHDWKFVGIKTTFQNMFNKSNLTKLGNIYGFSRFIFHVTSVVRMLYVLL